VIVIVTFSLSEGYGSQRYPVLKTTSPGEPATSHSCSSTKRISEMVSMKRNLKQTLDIANTSANPRVKLQAMAIAIDCYRFILDMTTNAGIVSDASKYVTQKTEQVSTLQKLDDRIEATEEEETTTTNGIY
jgi:hypothetical protein